MTDPTIERNARALIALRRNRQGPPPAAPDTMAAAYQTQFACERILCAEEGYEPIGWKIGATNAGSRAMLKLDAPFLGRLYRQMTAPAPALLPARPGLYRAYEAEIALELAHDLDASRGPVDATAVRAATRAVLPAIEMVGGYLPAGGPNGGLALIADFGGNANWIPGAEVTDFTKLDLEQGAISFFVDGEQRATGKGANVDGGPFGAAAWLANKLGKLGRALKAGEFITTGTAIPPVPFHGDGKTAVADFGPLGKVEWSIG